MIIKLVAAVQLFAMAAAPGMAADTSPVRAAPQDAKPMLPPRLLECDLGRIANFAPDRDQPASEYVYDSRHSFKLFLPAIPARTGPPPSPLKPAEPVDPRTRIVSDPDGIAAGADAKPFGRVVDMWPTRIELSTSLNDVVSNVIVVDQVDLRRSTAVLFMARANDAVTFDMKKLYYGKCNVVIVQV